MALTRPPTPLADLPPAAAEVLFEEARRRRRRRRIGWLVVVHLRRADRVGGLRPGRPPDHASPHDHSPPAADRPLPAGTPADIVGWLSSDQVVVIDTRTGAVVRTLATGVSVEAPGLPDLTVAPGGQVYFDSAPLAGVSPHDAEGDQIYSVPITGGPVVEVGPGSDPQVSPNGQLLAYLASDGAGEAPYLLPGGGIDVATLAGARVAGVRTLHPDPAQQDQGASDLSWSPDGQHLSFDLLGSEADTTTSWTIALAGAGSSLATAQQIPLQPAGLTWNGYLRVRGAAGSAGPRRPHLTLFRTRRWRAPSAS